MIDFHTISVVYKELVDYKYKYEVTGGDRFITKNPDGVDIMNDGFGSLLSGWGIVFYTIVQRNCK